MIHAPSDIKTMENIFHASFSNFGHFITKKERHVIQ